MISTNDGHDRAEVERAAAHPDRRQEAPEQVQVRVGHVADELEQRVEPAVVGHPRDPAE